MIFDLPNPKEEFNLSKERKKLFKVIAEQFARYRFADEVLTAEQRTERVMAFFEEQDKEFIRLLKEEFEECRDKTDIWDSERWNKFEKMFNKKISKLAGDDLK